ncbi:hypothetical protein RRSWK_00563 [Rhodopirellula sp. SWK7]|nr:hypothetical protein RRSWK_00563 [Rhodopirellula sp. SWK7]
MDQRNEIEVASSVRGKPELFSATRYVCSVEIEDETGRAEHSKR